MAQKWSESAQNDPDDPRHAWNQVILPNLIPFHWLWDARTLLARGWWDRSKFANMAAVHIQGGQWHARKSIYIVEKWSLGVNWVLYEPIFLILYRGICIHANTPCLAILGFFLAPWTKFLKFMILQLAIYVKNIISNGQPRSPKPKIGPPRSWWPMCSRTPKLDSIILV